MYTNEKTDIEINFLDLLRFVRTRWMAVLAAAVLCAVIGFLVPLSATTGAWTATGELVLYADGLQAGEQINLTEERKQLTDAAAALMTSYRAYEEALAFMGSDLSPTELAQCVTVTTRAQMFTITVKHSDPDIAREIATAMLAKAPSVVAQVLPDVELKSFGSIIMQGADGAVTGNRAVNAVLGGVFGGVLAVLLVMLVELLDTTVKNRRELEQLTGVPVLGVVPTARSGERESARAMKKAGRG